jgi:hypothetical protein
MADRLTLLDGLCRDKNCKQVIERHDVSDLAPSAALLLKQEIEGRGLLACHYTADLAAVKVPLLAHKAACSTLKVPPAEQAATEVMAAALGVKSQRTKKRDAKKRKKHGAKKK